MEDKSAEFSGIKEIRELAAILEGLQRSTNNLIRKHNLKGDEFHPLVVIDLQLYGLCCLARLAAGRFGKPEEKKEGEQ